MDEREEVAGKQRRPHGGPGESRGGPGREETLSQHCSARNVRKERDGHSSVVCAVIFPRRF